MSHVDKNMSSVAFMIYCVNIRMREKGTVTESLHEANNYHAEVLGVILVQLVLCEES